MMAYAYLGTSGKALAITVTTSHEHHMKFAGCIGIDCQWVVVMYPFTTRLPEQAVGVCCDRLAIRVEKLQSISNLAMVTRVSMADIESARPMDSKPCNTYICRVRDRNTPWQ